MNRRAVLKSIAIGVIAPTVWTDSSAKKTSTDRSGAKVNKPDETIWFKKPGIFWNSQSMHIGNGFLGLSFLGGVKEEKFSITEKSMWTGGPGEFKEYHYGIKKGGKDHLPKIRELVLSNEPAKLKQADQLIREKFLGNGQGYGHFSAFGRMSIVFDHEDTDDQHYTRKLDLTQSIANVDYQVGEVNYKRTYFCSYLDKVAVLNFKADQKNALSFRLKWEVFQKDHQLNLTGDVLTLSGKINGNQRAFCLRIQIRTSSGNISLVGQELIVERAQDVTLLLVAGTEYQPIAPLYLGSNPMQFTLDQLKATKDQSFADLKSRHVKDYQRLYNRVKLRIPAEKNQALVPSDERWKSYAVNGEDPSFKALYFNLSRYLLISSSRPGSLPANLQGAWNMFEAAAWSGNYQSNINVQLNYNSAGATDLMECQRSYIDWINGLVKPGTEVAKNYYNTEGWVSHSIGNIWGYAAPGFEIEWGIFPIGAAWHCHYVWKYYAYTLDKAYLSEKGYPILKGASLFWLQNLVAYKGYLVTAPSGSAEHGVIFKNGIMQATGSSFDQDILVLPANFQDIQMVKELFENTIKAAEVLSADAEFVAKLKATRSKLMPLKVGKYGQLQEWDADVDTPECNHRHIAQLYALWPAKQISANDPILAAAAKQTLNMRGEARNYSDAGHKDVYTAANWSLGLRMACWLRLQDAERANKIFTELITIAGFENLMTFQHMPTSANVSKDLSVFTAGEKKWLPIWQVDASLALGGFIAEMLVQTNAKNELMLLPALPKEWPSGSITGLKAEANLTIHLEWTALKVTKYSVYAPKKKRINVWVNGELKEIETRLLKNT